MAQVQRKRLLWYHSRIIDWMIANPGRPLYECAAMIGRTPSTLSVIINSDMFKAALAKRKAEFQMSHDFGIIQKTTQIAHASLDAILSTLEKKRDSVPLDTLERIGDSALKRLGYGIEARPQPGLTVNAIGGTVVVPASAADLAEARMAIRQVQQQRLPSQQVPAIEASYVEIPSEAVHATSDEEEERAPSPLPT